MTYTQINKIEAQYDRAADRFAKWSPSHQFKAIIDKTIFSSIHPNATILEVGCGHGTWIKYILDKSLAPISSFDGIDISENRISLAKNILNKYENVHLTTSSIENYESQRKYDLIYFAEVFQYIDDREYHEILTKCYNLLNENGIVIIIDKDKYSCHSFKILLKKHIGILPEVYDFVNYPNFNKLLQLSTHVGYFKVNQIAVKEFRALMIRRKYIEISSKMH